MIDEFKEINTSLKYIISLHQELEKKPTNNINENISEMLNRFYRLFELHDININEIPIVIDSKFNITLFDISTKENLLKKINNGLLEWLADFFYINIDWLLYKTDYMYNQHNFDKDIIGLSKFINKLSKDKSFAIEVLKSSELNNKVIYGSDTGQYIYPIIVVNQQIENISISKYILINSYMWSYKRTRLDFKIIIYLLYKGHVDYYKRRIYLSGYDINKDYSYSDFMKGNCSYFNLKHRYSVTWYPDDYIECENESESAVSKEIDEYSDLITSIEKDRYVYYLNLRLAYYGTADDFEKGIPTELKIVKNNLNDIIDNADKELILEGHARVISGEAGQIYRGYTNADHGIDGEIEFKNILGQASGKRVYMQLKSGDSYTHKRKSDGEDVFYIKKPRWVNYWTAHEYPVMLVIRTSDGNIRWMNVSEYLVNILKEQKEITKIIFRGEPFTKENIRKLRDEILGKNLSTL